MEAVNLSQTMDARVWARTFMEIVNQGATVDEDLMIGWLANAIMCGWDHRERHISTPDPDSKEEREKSVIRKTPEEWLATEEFAHIVVMDPDGWDRSNPDGPHGWNTPIGYDEFTQRLMLCTVGPVRRP